MRLLHSAVLAGLGEPAHTKQCCSARTSPDLGPHTSAAVTQLPICSALLMHTGLHLSALMTSIAERFQMLGANCKVPSINAGAMWTPEIMCHERRLHIRL